jgi:zinc D-Ala-D-Ala carboxypeptidase
MSEHFSDAELRCKCGCGRNLMREGFMRKLESLRVYLGFPMSVSSAYRCPTHNSSVSSTGLDGPHTTGRAIDIAVHGSAALKIIGRAKEFGFSGVGVSQKGTHGSRFIHLDDLDSTSRRPRPHVWSY